MSDERFILCQDDLGNDEIRYEGKVFHFLWEVAPILNEQQALIIKQDEEIKKLKRTERSWRRIHCCNKESNNCGIVIEQEATISRLEEEKGYWKRKAMTLLMQVRRLTPRMTDKEVIEFSKELDDE